jgi:hypothetical protein
MKKLFFITFAFLTCCSILSKKNDVNEDVKEFISNFQLSLSKPDSVILDQFRVNQSVDAIVAAIRLLQNQQDSLIQLEVQFDRALIAIENESILVTIPAIFQGGLEPEDKKSISFMLKRFERGFKIIRLEAEEFYLRYSSIRHQIESEAEIKMELANLEKYFDKAKEFQGSYDSVVWFAKHENKIYYYVVNGSWKTPQYNEKFQTGYHSMGLIDSDGKVIVPPAFDLIGTPGILFDNIVEVVKDNKVGYYSLSSEELVHAQFDLVVPYSVTGTRAITKIDSVYGTIDDDFKYHEGLPSTDAQEYVKSFGFLDGDIRYDAASQTICLTPSQELVGSGTIIPPTYLVKYGLFEPILGGFVTGLKGLFASTEFTQKESFYIMEISDRLKLLVTHFKSRFIGGREEFYDDHHITLVSDVADTLSTSTISYGQHLSFSRKDSTLLEAKMNYQSSWEPEESGLIDYPGYSYYRLVDNKIVKLESNRNFPMTEFVKLDSSYFTGPFSCYDFESENRKTIDFVPNNFLSILREEILAINGFATQSIRDRFKHADWYRPSTTSYDEVYEKATEIDKHNLTFIGRIIGPITPPSM